MKTIGKLAKELDIKRRNSPILIERKGIIVAATNTLIMVIVYMTKLTSINLNSY